jgi:hypothetical protein
MLKPKSLQFSKRVRQHIDKVRKTNARVEDIESAAARNANATSLGDKRASFLDLQRAAFPDARVGRPVVAVRGGAIRMRGAR